MGAKRNGEEPAKQKASLFSDEELVAFCGINCRDCKARNHRLNSNTPIISFVTLGICIVARAEKILF